jgi:hypothetical protein
MSDAALAGAGAAWFVIFPMTSPVVAWWHRLLRPGWRHCYAIRAVTPELLIEVNHGGATMRVVVQARSIGERLRAEMDATAALVLVVPDGAPPPPSFCLRGPMTCVEVTKAVLGVRAPCVFTPRQLWRHLRAMGSAHPVMPIPS